MHLTAPFYTFRIPSNLLQATVGQVHPSLSHAKVGREIETDMLSIAKSSPRSRTVGQKDVSGASQIPYLHRYFIV